MLELSVAFALGGGGGGGGNGAGTPPEGDRLASGGATDVPDDGVFFIPSSLFGLDVSRC